MGPGSRSARPCSRRSRGAALGRLCAAAAATASLILAAAPPAVALPVTIDFESGVSADQLVTNQYGEPGTPAGPSFMKGTDAGFNGLACGAPSAFDDASRAYSGSKGVVLNGCPGGEFWPTAAFFKLGWPSREVQFAVGSSGGTGPACCIEIRTTSFRADGSVIQRQSTMLLPNQTAKGSYKLVPLLSSADDIAFVAVEAGTYDPNNPNPSSATGVYPAVGQTHLVLDDLTYDPPSSPPDSSFRLGASPASTIISAGRSASVNVPVTWTANPNPAASPVSFELSAPSGIEGSFTPNPSNTGSTVVKLDVAKNAPDGTQLVTVTGYVDKGLPSQKSASVVIPVTVTIPFLVTPPGDLLVTPCSASEALVRVATDTTFPDTLSVTLWTSASQVWITAIDGQPVARTKFITRNLTQQNGQATMLVRMETDLTAKPESPAQLAVTASSPGYATRQATGTVGVDAGEVSRALFAGTSNDIATVRPPQFGRAPTRIDLRGRGFCPGSLVRFGAAGAVASPLSTAPDGRSLTVDVPRGALSGPVTVIRPGGGLATKPGTPLNVLGLRANYGYSFPNFAAPDNFRFDQFVRVFGDSMYLKIDPCDAIPFTFGLVDCPVTTGIPDPIAAIIHVALQGRGKLGLCYGMSRTAGFFASGASWSWLSPPKAPYPNALDPAPGSNDLLEEIETAYLYQFSTAVLNATAAQTLTSSGASGPVRAGRLRQLLDQELGQNAFLPFGGRPMMISLRDDGSGHVLLAYDVEDTGGGRFDIHVYDPNIPFNAAEAADAGAHAFRADRSRISVDPAADRWTFAGLEKDDGKGGKVPWSGPIDGKALFAIPGDVAYAGTAKLVGLHQLGQLIVIASLGTRLDQVGDERGRVLLDPQGDPATGARAIPRAAAIPPTDAAAGPNPIAALPAGGSYEISGRRTRAGRLLAAGREGVASAVIAPGSASRAHGTVTDRMQVAQGARDITFVPGAGGAMTLQLGAGRGPSAHVAALSGPAAQGTRDRIVLATDGLTLEHRGPAAARRLTLAGGGRAATIALGRMLPGQRAVVRVGSWRRPGSATAVTRGRRLHARASRLRLIRSLRVRARRQPGRRAAVSVTLARRGSARPLATSTTVVVLRGRRRLAVRTFAFKRGDLGRRRIVLRWTARRLPAGRLRVVAVATTSASGADGVPRTDVRAARAALR